MSTFSGRMELVAAAPSGKISALLKRELQINYNRKMFLTESEATLVYTRIEIICKREYCRLCL